MLDFDGYISFTFQPQNRTKKNIIRHDFAFSCKLAALLQGYNNHPHLPTQQTNVVKRPTENPPAMTQYQIQCFY